MELVLALALTHFHNLQGIIKALRESSEALKAAKVHIYVRRGGPNYQEGLNMMRELGTEIGIPIEVRIMCFLTPCLANCKEVFLKWVQAGAEIRTLSLGDLAILPVHRTCIELYNYLACEQENDCSCASFLYWSSPRSFCTPSASDVCKGFSMWPCMRQIKWLFQPSC